MSKIFCSKWLKGHLEQFLSVILFSSLSIASYAELPVPDANNFVSSGLANFAQSATTATINQSTDRAILNWQSFNIGKGNTVNFNQPSATSTTLNRINQNSPSQIFGNLNANGQIYLINNNGIVFGKDAQVNVGGLISSTLDVSDEVFESLNIVTAIRQGLPAFEGGTADMAEVILEDGAQITTADGGRVLMFAPKVSNQGDINTPGGQTILGGVDDKVYLYAADSDSGIRGLLVELGTGGDVENVGNILAERGNITLIGQAVRQAGSLSATTSVQENGSIRLLARDNARLNNPLIPTAAEATRTGELIVDSNSISSVLPENDANNTASDNIMQSVSTIELMGKTIELKSGSTLKATGGDIDIIATTNPLIEDVSFTKQDARLFVDANATIDVSGDTSTTVSVSRYGVTAEIRSNELADLPVQKNGVLQDEEILIDARLGADVADVTNAVNSIERSAAERLSTGGNINIVSDGDVVIKKDANIDISGGLVSHTEGTIQTTLLETVDFQLVDITNADPNVRYNSISDSLRNTFHSGYVEGKDGGQVSILTHDAVIEGDFTGTVLKGDLQRQLPQSLGDSQSFARNFMQAPAHSEFNLDLDINDFNRRDIIITSNPIYESTGLAVDTLIPLDHAVILSNSLFNTSGIGNFNLSVPTLAGSITVAENSPLALTANATIRFDSLLSEVMQGSDISSIGGDIAIIGETVRLNGGSDINVAGIWVNDNYASRFQQMPSFEMLLINGGNIELSGNSEVSISSGSVIDVSGGAYLPATGDLSEVLAGNAGSISILTEPTPIDIDDAILDISGIFKGFTLLGGQGGTLEIQGNGVEVNSSGIGPDSSVTYLDDNLFSNGGFQNYIITSTRDGLTIDSTARINSIIKNYMLNGSALGTNSGPLLSSISAIGTSPDYIRTPTSLSFNALQSSLITNSDKGISNLLVENGAQIIADTEGSITLLSDNSLLVNGLVHTPSGSVNLNLTTPTYSGDDLGFLANQYIWLGDTARLDVSGAVLSRPRANPPSPDFPDEVFVLDAGNVSVNADRGYVITESNSIIDVQGASGTSLQVNGILIDQVELFGNAGSVNIETGSGLILNGGILANAVSPSASNGELNVLLDQRASIDVFDLAPGGRVAPDTPRIIELSNNFTDPGAEQGQAIDDTFHGKAFINLNEIQNSGIDNLSLSLNVGSVLSGTSLIRFNDNVNFSTRQGINLNTPVIDVLGNNVSLESNYLSIGPDQSANQFSFMNDLEGGSGEFNLAAQNLDIIGDVAIQGINTINFTSSGDVRLIGVPNLTYRFDDIGDLFAFGDLDSMTSREISDGLLAGSLNFNGDLVVNALQLYPSIFTKYSILNQNTSEGLVQVNSPKNSIPHDTLSALGSLLIESPKIVNNGNIKAPNGRIKLVATSVDSLVLTENSLTSVGLDDQDVLFGRTEAGDWVYRVEFGTDFQTVVFDELPESFIEFQSPRIDFSDGAVVDISGSGDLLAYEHIPGPNGSVDILSLEINPDYFAIVPSFNAGFAPYDIAESPNDLFTVGSEIIIDQSVNGLTAGRYTLLPARYALLPGAFLVRPEPGITNINQFQALPLADGSSLVSGRLAISSWLAAWVAL
ncbi:MAG: filamentous hemagglutinin N-terminal domain-containing protein [Pseudomonadota bacterium]